ncbi:MAG: hypothetical protein LQ338_005679 [Usnochroma carphineum]|nr:MAG: hypothetical protein LQ338_005679 [Usnochroma carphineum]
MTHRAQGYRFRVTGRGVKSCRDVLSPEHFELLRATCGDIQVMESKRINALTGAPLESFDVGHRHMGEKPLMADRGVMRQVLFKGLEGYTTFGKEIVGYEDASADSSRMINGNDEHLGVLVRFSDGSTVHGALLVGADGAYSQIRGQLAPQFQLLDSELRMVFGKTPLTPAFYTALGVSNNDDSLTAELLKGPTVLADPSRTSPMLFIFEVMRFSGRASAAEADPVLAAAIPSDYVFWAFGLRNDQLGVQGVDWSSLDASAAADLAEDLTKFWLPSLRPVVTHQNRQETIPLRCAIMPIPLLNWRAPPAGCTAKDSINGSDPPKASPNFLNQQLTSTLSPMVTLIGDAAHVMPPTGGVGATTAFTDAAVLGASLARHGVSRRALEVYEAEMRDYAAPAIELSLKNGKFLMGMRDLEEMKPMER